MKASLKRETRETRIEVSLDTEGSGFSQIKTCIKLLDDILLAFVQGSSFDLIVKAKGDLDTGDHHTAEDVAITLGKVLAQTIRKGIGSSIVPSGDCLAMAVVRFGETGYESELEFQAQEIGGMRLKNIDHFFRSLSYSGKFVLHIHTKGSDDRRKIEAASMALGRALKKASREGFL